MDLEKHISKLLLTNDCVIVPGFGGFMTHHVEAVYDKDMTTFYPPTRTLGFSKQLTMNDSLIVQSFVEEYDMSFPEAFSRVEESVAELKQAIETSGQYEMHGLGTFTVADNGTYEFVPCEAGILTPELYGLDSIEFICIEKKSQTHTEKSPAKVVALRTPAIDAEENEEPLLVSENDSVDEESGEKSQWQLRSFVTKVAVACIAFVVMLLIPSSLSETQPRQFAQSGIDTNLLMRVMPKTVVKSAPTLKALPTPQSNDKIGTKTELQAESEPTVKKESPYYSIVLASRVTLKNAEAYVEALHKDGYVDATVLVKGKSVKVVYGKFDTEVAARKTRNKLSDNIEFNDSWILEVK